MIALDISQIAQLVTAAWSGRDAATIETHLRELEAIGVKRPRATPVFYRLAASLLTTADRIEVLGSETSGEAEAVLFALGGELLVGIGSDHTDRKVQIMGVALSKQICAKPVGPTLWRFAELAPHWDELRLRAWATIDGKARLYQEGSLASMRRPEDLIGLYTGSQRLPDGTALFCGTLAARGGITPAERFEIELEDPVLGRTLRHAYSVVPLPAE
jgi:hypothetical protein